MRRLWLTVGFVVAGFGQAMAQPAPACPTTFQNQSGALTCACTPEAAASGSVWGTGVYTTDSRVCRAAVHAGAIQATGGIVTVTPATGLPVYVGSVANGITTSNYGPWSGSFTVAAPSAGLAACPQNFEGRSAALNCACAPEAAASGPVWGTGVYTTDSRVCRAAVHAGAIQATGGNITVTPAPGLPAYIGSAANGVTTANYGAWRASFTVAAGPAGAVAAAGPAACPSNFQGRSDALSCNCSAEAAASGPVWGTGAYTTDSRICRAAVHAGVIPATGGVVNVVPAPGLPTYPGSAANGITTSNYGPWSASFTFRR